MAIDFAKAKTENPEGKTNKQTKTIKIFAKAKTDTEQMQERLYWWEIGTF